MKVLVLLGILLIGGPVYGATYQYEGNNFTLVNNESWFLYQMFSFPGYFTTEQHLSASITLSQPLPSNLTYGQNALNDVSGIVSWSMTDGRVVMDQGDARLASVLFATDSSGQIVDWQFAAVMPGPPGNYLNMQTVSDCQPIFCLPPQDIRDSSEIQVDYTYAGLMVAQGYSYTQGTWVVASQCGAEEPVCLTTPLPGALWLFLSGLIGILVLRRAPAGFRGL